MPPRISRRLAVAAITALGLLAASACQSQPDAEKSSSPAGPTSSRPPAPPAPPPGPLKNEIPMPPARDGHGRPTSRAWVSWSSTSTSDAVKAFRDGARAGPGLDPRLDQPGDRAAQRQRRQGGRGEESRRRSRRCPAISTRPSISWPACWIETRTTRTRTSAAASSSSRTASSARPTGTSSGSPRSIPATRWPGTGWRVPISDPSRPSAPSRRRNRSRSSTRPSTSIPT